MADPRREGGAASLAFCRAHLRPHFYDIAKGGAARLAEEALARIAAPMRSKQISAVKAPRRAARAARPKPCRSSPRSRAGSKRITPASPPKSGTAFRYRPNHRDGLARYLDDGRIEIDTNIIERGMRPIALNRKNALFARHDAGPPTGPAPPR